MARVGVHVEAELIRAAVDLDDSDQSYLFDEVRNALEVYFAKLVGGIGVNAKVESLTVDYGKLGKKDFTGGGTA